jgi:hypothetical protein
MPIIIPDTPVIAQINVFTVPPGGQQALIEGLTRAAAVAGEVDANAAYGTAHPGLYEVVRTVERAG